MSSACPWCNASIEDKFVRNLGRVPEPCPHCGNPLRESFYQVMFGVAIALPFAGLLLVLAKIVFESGSRAGSVVVVLGGIVVWVYLHRYIPTVHGPSRGRDGHDT